MVHGLRGPHAVGGLCLAGSWPAGRPGRAARRSVRGQGRTEGPVLAHRRNDLDPGREALSGQITRSSRAGWLLATRRSAAFALKPIENAPRRCGAAQFLARGATNEPRESARGLETGLSRMLLGLIIVCGLLSIVYGVYTINSLMAADAGTARMQEISGAVAEGAQAYLRRQYTTIAGVGVVVFIAPRPPAFVDGGDRVRDRRHPVRRRRLYRHERLGARQRAHRAGGDEIARRRSRHRLPLGRCDRSPCRRARASRRRWLLRHSHRPSRLCALGSRDD